MIPDVNLAYHEDELNTIIFSFLLFINLFKLILHNSLITHCPGLNLYQNQQVLDLF